MFISEEFWFDNIFSKDMEILLVSMDSDIINEYGFVYSKSLDAEFSLNNHPYFKNKNEVAERIKLCFCLANIDTGEAYTWDAYTLEKVYKWLIQDEFKSFVSKDDIELTYYLKATSVTKKFNKNMRGYLEIEFQPFTNFAYKNYKKSTIVKGTREIMVNNISNIEEKTYSPILEVKNLSDGDISIKNITTNDDPLVFTEVGLDETIVVDNFMYTVINSEGVNRFDSCNRNWLQLKKGKNIIRFDGEFKVTLKAKFPVII